MAVHLAPFAGIAFLWFIGVLRNRLGTLEDQFFATVFLGSGLLFVASLFAAAAFSGAIVEAIANGHTQLLNSETYYVVRLFAGAFLNVFAIKMAGVFMFSTSTIIFRTGRKNVSIREDLDQGGEAAPGLGPFAVAWHGSFQGTPAS